MDGGARGERRDPHGKHSEAATARQFPECPFRGPEPSRADLRSDQGDGEPHQHHQSLDQGPPPDSAAGQVVPDSTRMM